MRLLASDFDGTITNRPIDQNLISGINSWMDAGNLFGIVSGRPLRSIKDTIDSVNIPVNFLIANNGAVISNGHDNILNITSMDFHVLENFFSLHMEEGISTFLIANSSNDYKRLILENKPKLIDKDHLLINDDIFTEITQIFVGYPNSDVGKEISNKIATQLENSIIPLFNSPEHADWVDRSVNKANGIKKLVECLGITPEKIITVGDFYNDLDMLICKDFEGYAVENAPDEIKQMVGRVIGNPIEIMARSKL